MKNQNDLIISIVAGVLALIIAIVSFVTKPEPVRPADPQQVVTTPAKLPTAAVSMTNSLPGGGTSAAGGGFGGFGGGFPGARGGAPAFASVSGSAPGGKSGPGALGARG